MNKFLRFAPALLMIVLTACTGILTSSKQGTEEEHLAACTGIDSMFANIDFKKWPEKYHKTVADTVEAHLKSLQEVQKEQLQCTAPDYPSVVKPTNALKDLAKTLPPWKERTQLSRLSEMDIGSVLLEYLRIYECALSERKNDLTTIIRRENASSAGSDTSMDRITFNNKLDEQQRIINKELAVSRPALDRTLMIVGGEDRLRPLSIDIECLKRVSLDIRNIMGLVSQASACMPRIRDARGSLRDLPDLPPSPVAPATP